MKMVFSLLLISFVFTAVKASDKPLPPLDVKTTENGYKKNDFCVSNAMKRIKDLDNQSKSELEKVKQTQSVLNQLTAKKNIMKGFLDLRDQFVTSLDNIIKDKDSKDKANIEDFRKLLRSSLAIQAVSTLYNTSNVPTDPKTPVTVDTLCTSQENINSAFCKHIKSKWFSGSITGPLNQSLNNLRSAQKELSEEDNQKMRSTFLTVMGTLSTRVSPEAVLDTLSNRAQTLSPLLADEMKNDLSKCIKGEFDDACKKLMTGDSRDNIKKLLMTEISDVKNAFADSRQSFIDSQLNSIYKTADDIDADKKTRVTNLFRTKLDSAMALFADQSGKQKLADIGIDEDTYETFKTSCSDSKSRDNCNEISKKLISFFEAKMKDVESEIATQTAELNSLASTGGSLGKILKMRQYVAQKYVRSCPNAFLTDVRMPNSTCNFLNGSAPAGEDDAVTSLNGKLSGVVSRLLQDNAVSSKRGELGVFSKDELKVYENYCSGTTAGNTYQDICNDIYRESNAIKNIKESKEWAEFSDKYWIIPNDRSSKGYDVYEKKSNARIFGEGLSQSVGQIYPMYFTNFNLKYQIENMENQALFFKQLNYMYTPTSPSMANSYFQGTYYAFPSSTNFASPFSTSAGFNFSK